MFSEELTQNERLDLINKEYNIPIDDGIRKDVSVMCNLSQGIKEAGIAEGKAAGIAEVVTFKQRLYIRTNCSCNWYGFVPN